MTILGFDPGMGAIKLYGEKGGVELPSQVATNGSRHLMHTPGLARRRNKPVVVATEAGEFYVGLGAHDYGRPVENLDYDRLTGSPEMHALFYGALSLAQAPSVLSLVVVGLPIEALSGEEAKTNAAAVRRWLRGEHRWETDGHTHAVTVEDVLVTPQPVGALFDYALDEEGNFIQGRKKALTQEVGVISIGFNTIELLVIRNKAPVDRFTAGNTSGVRRLLEIADPQRLYSLGELDTMLRLGKLDIRAALPVWGREVTGQIEKVWGRMYRRFERIIVVGGGAVLLQDALMRRFGGKAFVPDKPVVATARGLYKIGVMKTRRKR